MRELLKKMRGYLIYNGFFFLMLLLGYCLETGRFVGQDCDWIWLWLVVAYWVSMFEVFLAGPAFALFYQMYQFTVKEIFWSALIILVSTFLSLSVMDLCSLNNFCEPLQNDLNTTKKNRSRSRA